MCIFHLNLSLPYTISLPKQKPTTYVYTLQKYNWKFLIKKMKTYLSTVMWLPISFFIPDCCISSFEQGFRWKVIKEGWMGWVEGGKLSARQWNKENTLYNSKNYDQLTCTTVLMILLVISWVNSRSTPWLPNWTGVHCWHYLHTESWHMTGSAKIHEEKQISLPRPVDKLYMDSSWI